MDLGRVVLRRLAGDFSADLSDQAIRDILGTWESPKIIPREVDSALLVGARERLGRDLDDGERANLRFDFIKSLRHVPLNETEGDVK